MGTIKNQKASIQIKGLSLIELIVTLGTTIVIGGAVVNLFLSTIRGAAKSRVLTEVKQNGDYALAVMDRIIRNAEKVEDKGGNFIKIKNPDQTTTEFKCESEKITSNGNPLTSGKVKVSSVCDTFLSYQELIGKPIVVEIQFNLSQSGAALGKEFEVMVPFQRTVSTRTY